ncbi:MAG: C39 family peptidase [Anaerolineae bacterium]
MLLLTAGSIRYGGPDGLLLRVRAEIAARRPHPEFVPTPLPTATAVLAPGMIVNETEPEGTSPLAAAQPTTESMASPTPTRTPTIPPTPSLTPAHLSQLLPARTTAGSGPHDSPSWTGGDRPPLISSSSRPVLDPRSGVRERPGQDPGRGLAATGSPQPPDPSPQLSATPTPAYLPAAASVDLTGFNHIWQKWNNCGPATLAMDLSYFGLLLDQKDVAAVLKPNRDDKNVNPEEMAEFARSQGFHALVRVNGDFDRLRLLLSNGVPVLVETWLELEPGNGMGHYRLLTGYNDASQQWTAFDSYVSVGVAADQPYRGIHLSYEEMGRLWTVFNRTYVLIYSDEVAPLVLSILGDEVDDSIMWQRALRQAQVEVEQRPDDPFARFNLGTDLTALGQFEQAGLAYDRARVIGLPWRMLWYQFGPFRAYYESGRYEELIALADATIATAGDIEEVYYWKGLGLAAQGDTAGARQVWKRALELNSNYAEAASALSAIGAADSESEGTQPEATPGNSEG